MMQRVHLQSPISVMSAHCLYLFLIFFIEHWLSTFCYMLGSSFNFIHFLDLKI